VEKIHQQDGQEGTERISTTQPSNKQFTKEEDRSMALGDTTYTESAAKDRIFDMINHEKKLVVMTGLNFLA